MSLIPGFAPSLLECTVLVWLTRLMVPCGVFELYGAAMRCCDVVLWLHTVPGCPGIVEVGTMFRY
jgi:hypothetical protein